MAGTGTDLRRYLLRLSGKCDTDRHLSLIHIFVKAVTNYQDPALLASLSENLGEAMVGINESEIALLMAERGK